MRLIGPKSYIQAFVKTWKAACEARGVNPVIFIPQGKRFLLQPIQFQGPCIPNYIQIQLMGTLVAPPNLGSWIGRNTEKWLSFVHVQGLSVNGYGQIDGQGFNWWWHCVKALSFDGCDNLEVRGLYHINSARNHISIGESNNVTISGLHITAPKDSPNTDGIDIAASTNVRISNTVIQTGDDCIAINTGCSNINITGVTCGPGHGISVGSLGMNGQDSQVDGVFVQHCTFIGTQNGVRIKTWQGGSGYARRIYFSDIILNNAGNPIIIDQSYCYHCLQQESAVQISDVSYTRIYGTSSDPIAINLGCSQLRGCANIQLAHINITSAHPPTITSSKCVNAHGGSIDTTPKVDCLVP
ncbi:Probable polygalacturonase At3g15720 [Linum grandiflorum]